MSCINEHLERMANTGSIGNVFEWENKRTYWWYGYYKDSTMPKLNKSTFCKPKGIRGVLKYYRKDAWYARDPKRRKELVMRTISQFQKKESTKTKPRWTKEQRRHKSRFY